MYRNKNSLKIDYFNVEGTPGGNQDWCTDFWMNLGGCGALAACDISICLSQNAGYTRCCPYAPDALTKKQYVDFSMMMKPYIHPRMGGVSKVSIFTEGYEKYLNKQGYKVKFDICSGENTYEEACAFMKKALEKNLPIAYLLLRHRDKRLKDLNWHWFMITGYQIKEGRIFLYYHTYGEEEEVDFEILWNTGMYRKGGMAAVKEINEIMRFK